MMGTHITIQPISNETDLNTILSPKSLNNIHSNSGNRYFFMVHLE